MKLKIVLFVFIMLVTPLLMSNGLWLISSYNFLNSVNYKNYTDNQTIDKNNIDQCRDLNCLKDVKVSTLTGYLYLDKGLLSFITKENKQEIDEYRLINYQQASLRKENLLKEDSYQQVLSLNKFCLTWKPLSCIRLPIYDEELNEYNRLSSVFSIN